MGDITASVIARLKNKSKETGRSNQLCLQLFAQEEFLRRLEKSKYADYFVLKGGLFLYTLTGFDSRVTVDVDFLLRQIPNTPEKIKEVVDEIIISKTENTFITFEIKNISPISVMKLYPGVHVDIIASIGNTRSPFGIDFGVGDVIVPGAQKRKIPTQLSGFSEPEIQTYSIETTIAEKLDAILDLLEFSSRMKDYYDIWYLANKFEFNGTTLVSALRKTFSNRHHNFTSEQFIYITHFDTNMDMQKKWNAFCRRVNVDIDFSIVLETINKFLLLPMECITTGKDLTYIWNPANQVWK